MTKIEKLIPDEEALISNVRDKWIKISLATGPSDREAAQAAISDTYRVAGLEPPRHWIWLGSPWAGCTGAWMLSKLRFAEADMRRVWISALDQVSGQVEDEVLRRVREKVESPLLRVDRQVWNKVRGQVAGYPVIVHYNMRDYLHMRDCLWSEVRDKIWSMAQDQMEVQVREQIWAQVQYKVWAKARAKALTQMWKAIYGKLPHTTHLVFFDFFRRLGRVKGPEQVEPLMRAVAATGWWWPFEEACIITERPSALYRDGAGQLHCDNGPALAYPDGWAIHAWHGTRIPAWFVENKRRMAPDAIDAEGNVELRRVMLEIFGFDRYIEARGARLIAEDQCLGLPRQLFEIDLNGERIRVLRVVNGTLEADGRRRQFHLGVPLTCNTPHEAVAWSYGRPPVEYREALRT
jgi:hypothetical protein